MLDNSDAAPPRGTLQHGAKAAMTAVSIALGTICSMASSHAQPTDTSKAAVATQTAASAAQQAAIAAARSASAAAASASIVASVSPVNPASASARPTEPKEFWAPPAGLFLYGLPLVALVFTLITMLWVKGALAASAWSLADALSEEVPLPVSKRVIDAVTKTEVVTYEYGPDAKLLLAPQLKASTSRVIAFIGMVAIVFLYLGFGTFALFTFGRTGRLPESMSEVVTFLVSGLTLFAPYAVNKLAALVQGATSTK